MRGLGTLTACLLTLLFLSLAHLPGCDEGSGDTCRTDADCPPDQSCQDYCDYACIDARDPDTCVLGCYPPSGHCGTNQDCPDGRCLQGPNPMACYHCGQCDCFLRTTNHACTEPRDPRWCSCVTDADCAAGQACTAEGCAQNGVEADCGDHQDDDGDGHTDCEDRADCDGRPCGVGAYLGPEEGLCALGECQGCGVESCASDADCAACGVYLACDPVRACCTPCLDCACL
jgi:hypothetical protein